MEAVWGESEDTEKMSREREREAGRETLRYKTQLASTYFIEDCRVYSIGPQCHVSMHNIVFSSFVKLQFGRGLKRKINEENFKNLKHRYLFAAFA